LLEITMQRRTFVTAALAGAATSVVLPRMAQAEPGDDWTNVVFTQSDPGHWKDMEKHHVPLVKVEGSNLTVTTPHPMSEAHYIVSHTVVLEGGKFLDRKTFNWKDKPVSEHTLPEGYKGKVSVTSTCNLHDYWVKTLPV
jgi:superoxide reductase